MWKSRHRHKKFYRITLNFRKLLQFFLETFQQLLEASEVEPFLSTLADIPGRFPQKCLEQVFCKANLRACASVKKNLHSWRYLRNFSEFQKCARLESFVFGMQFTRKELHYITLHYITLPEFSLDISENCLRLMLQTADFLKFPEDLLFETH